MYSLALPLDLFSDLETSFTFVGLISLKLIIFYST